MIPIGVVQGVTSIQIGLNIITELICGFALPGRPVAMMIFKTFGYISMNQYVALSYGLDLNIILTRIFPRGLSFVQDLKYGHYMKIPPRAMFAAQVVAAAWSSLVQILVTCFLFSHVKNLCSVDLTQPISPSRYICQSQHTYMTASIIFGLLSPYRTFAKRQDYKWVNLMFLIGAVTPIPT